MSNDLPGRAHGARSAPVGGTTMSTQMHPDRPTPDESMASDVLTYGAVHLDVTDEVRALAFWSGIVGLEPLAHSGEGVSLGAGTRALVVLHPGATRGQQPGRSGLYHLALHVPDEAAFAHVLLRLAAARHPQAPTDHITHWATYLNDPDGIGLEVSFETFDRVSRYEAGPDWPRIIDSDGRERGAVEHLDVESVLAHADGRDASLPMPIGTRVGHLHLHVADLDDAQGFYADVLGLTRNVAAPRIGFADLSAGGTFPHRLAVNTWQRPGTPPSPGTAGMRHYVTEWPSLNALHAAIARLEAGGHVVGHEPDGVMVRDPAGNRLLLTAART